MRDIQAPDAPADPIDRVVQDIGEQFDVIGDLNEWRTITPEDTLASYVVDSELASMHSIVTEALHCAREDNKDGFGDSLALLFVSIARLADGYDIPLGANVRGILGDLRSGGGCDESCGNCECVKTTCIETTEIN